IKWGIAGVVVAVAAFLGFRYWKGTQSALPDGIASGNGRLEGTLVDVAAKEPLRVKEVLVEEGAVVKPGDVVVRLDTTTLESQLEEARASVVLAQERLDVAKASITKQKSEVKLAGVEAARSTRLVADGAGSQRELDVRNTQVETTTATLAEVVAGLKTAKQNVEVAQANVATIQTRIDDATLRSPVSGRVLYRLAEPGEVLAAGGKALTLVNLDDVYMEIFLPADQAASLAIGSEARLKVDYEPKKAVAGYVSFVSPEAQFTPKQVETKTEREKLMFRVKIQVPKDFVARHIDRVKTGVRGVGYVKYKDVAWPPSLNDLIEPPQQGPVVLRP
ncbi:MAG TPA: HlyD family efflux transporter periplasmic adaptor subunit, partial [Polyangiaceae bacterium]